jgi:Enoyl-CoA hydratase/isomerase
LTAGLVGARAQSLQIDCRSKIFLEDDLFEKPVSTFSDHALACTFSHRSAGTKMAFTTLVYTTDGSIATIMLNRPEHLNTIVLPMPDEFEATINLAIRDRSVKVIVPRGAARAFCAGYGFGDGFHARDEFITTDGAWTRARTSPGRRRVNWRRRRSS